MFFELSELYFWPSRDGVDENFPAIVLLMFPSKRVILDATEGPIQKPTRRRPNAQKSGVLVGERRDAEKIIHVESIIGLSNIQNCEQHLNSEQTCMSGMIICVFHANELQAINHV